MTRTTRQPVIRSSGSHLDPMQRRFERLSTSTPSSSEDSLSRRYALNVSFYYVGCVYCKMGMIVDDHGNLRCERHACVNGNTYFLATVGHGLFYVVDLIRPVFGRSVRRRCKRPFSYARNHADVQVEHFGRDR